MKLDDNYHLHGFDTVRFDTFTDKGSVTAISAWREIIFEKNDLVFNARSLEVGSVSINS